MFDVCFVPIALSDMSYVTDADGVLSREGTLVRGPGCPVLRADDGLAYSLAGPTPDLDLGTRVIVEGRIAPSSACPPAITLHVIRSSPPSP